MPRIVFCLPGSTYSREFLMAWTDLAMQVASKGHEITMLQYPTTKEVVETLVQTPCDYAMWIGSNVVFTPANFFALLESPHDVTAGMSLTLYRSDAHCPSLFTSVTFRPTSDTSRPSARDPTGFLLRTGLGLRGRSTTRCIVSTTCISTLRSGSGTRSLL